MSDSLIRPDYKTVLVIRAAQVCLGAAALIWLLQTGQPVFMPLILAFVAGIVFAPLADTIDRLGAPRAIGALAVLMLVLFVFLALILLFYPVLAGFMTRIPIYWFEIREALSGVQSLMQNMADVQERMAGVLNPEGGGSDAENAAEVVPGAAELLSYLPSVAGQMMVFAGVLYFFLLTRTDMYELIDRKSSLLNREILCRAETDVSRYFLAITSVNAAFGALVVLVLSALGMPNAIYWGIGAFLVNFVLYLGPTAFALMLLIAGMVVFDGLMSFAPAAIYLTMNMIEAQFVTPSVVGRHVSVNPLLVFVSLVFWIWLWGPLGGLVAIPFIVWMRQLGKAVNDVQARATARRDDKQAFGAAGTGEPAEI